MVCISNESDASLTSLCSPAPKLIGQILLTGVQIFGKALAAAGKQAIQNAKHHPEALSSDVGGIRNATSGSATDKLTREHRMTLDEAHLILNVKRGEAVENIVKNYEHLFKVNTLRPAPDPPVSGSRTGRLPPPSAHSHYLQSKVVRARERIEAEMRVAQEDAPAGATKAEAESNSPRPGSS
ncbi:protein transporter [Lanmaoa asiatica]|nr:protein transporter [Lanmaoa asiatica]